ncbi:SDR family NAD(P)-dependent oxidoreductase [Nocardia sp. NPDC058499]|uniref:SDR family NAD(P)-dependent oxidoreductase n=1 Tax=Nocardia sp. NPDC058499 TaxID=3346530 RepID=UPI003661E2B8
MDAATLDGHWAVDARSVLLVTQALAKPYRPGHGDVGDRGRVIWIPSGRHLGPMRGEIAYGAAKSVLAGMTATVAAELTELGIVLNTVNPGPVDTGYLERHTTGLDPALVDAVHDAFLVATPAHPTIRRGSSNGWSPTTAAGWWDRSPRASIDSEGGFRRSRFRPTTGPVRGRRAAARRAPPCRPTPPATHRAA